MLCSMESENVRETLCFIALLGFGCHRFRNPSPDLDPLLDLDLPFPLGWEPPSVWNPQEFARTRAAWVWTRVHSNQHPGRPEAILEAGGLRHPAGHAMAGQIPVLMGLGPRVFLASSYFSALVNMRSDACQAIVAKCLAESPGASISKGSVPRSPAPLPQGCVAVSHRPHARAMPTGRRHAHVRNSDASRWS